MKGETRMMQWLFLIAAALGAALPLSYLVPFLAAHGLDMPLFFRQLFQNNISAFFGTDVFVSALALWLLIFSEGRRRGMKHLWVYVLCTLLVGVSLGLPLFLFFRERKLISEQHA
jgi:Terpene cyclase DEP1